MTMLSRGPASPGLSLSSLLGPLEEGITLEEEGITLEEESVSLKTDGFRVSIDEKDKPSKASEASEPSEPSKASEEEDDAGEMVISCYYLEDVEEEDENDDDDDDDDVVPSTLMESNALFEPHSPSRGDTDADDAGSILHHSNLLEDSISMEERSFIAGADQSRLSHASLSHESLSLLSRSSQERKAPRSQLRSSRRERLSRASIENSSQTEADSNAAEIRMEAMEMEVVRMRVELEESERLCVEAVEAKDNAEEALGTLMSRTRQVSEAYEVALNKERVAVAQVTTLESELESGVMVWNATEAREREAREEVEVLKRRYVELEEAGGSGSRVSGSGDALGSPVMEEELELANRAVQALEEEVWIDE